MERSNRTNPIMNMKSGETDSKFQMTSLLLSCGGVAAFLREEEGVTSIEYALLAALIAMAIVSAVGGVGTQLQVLWERVSDAIVQAAS